jgi:hypothetical protein
MRRVATLLIVGCLAALTAEGVIANCKFGHHARVVVANCKLKTEEHRRDLALLAPAECIARNPCESTCPQFAVCNLQFAICNPLCVADPEQSVDSGRKALDSWNGYPWYDRATDELRRVDPPKPPPPASPPSPGTGNFTLGPILQVMAWTVIALGLALVIYLLWRAFVLRPRELQEAEDEARAGQAARMESLPFPVAPGKLDLLTEARRHYEQGNLRQAIIYLFSFQLVRLDRQQFIHLAKGKTNRQYLRELGPRQTLRWIVEQTMVAFEDVFFGNHAIDRGRFESCWTRVSEFERLTAEA